MKLTDDLKDARWMYLKAFLFLVAGGTAAFVLWWENQSLRTAVLLYIAIWSFCRLYYFAFYVIEKYIDPTYKFSGLFSFVVYLLRKRTRRDVDSQQ